MIPFRGITVAVGEWYARTLEICLRRNMRHMTECLVITTPRDELVKEIAGKVPGVRVYETDDFYAHGAHFNKGLCIERGFDVLGRDGWLMVWDSDCLWPDEMPLGELRTDTLYGARRRMLADPAAWTPDLDWRTCPMMADGGPIGFAQLFHADAPCLRDRRPWYDVSFAHAGGGDAYFMDLFPRDKRRGLPLSVLHLGERDRSWFGTSPEAREIMSAFVIRNGWRRRPYHDPEAARRVGEIVERVEVPGYEPSAYELPFVRRAKAQKADQQSHG